MSNAAQRAEEGWEVVRRLGSGGMAEVFLVWEREAGRRTQLVVAKALLPHLAADPDFIEMFTREARTSALLDHPNIVHTFGVKKLKDDRPCLVMEFLRGRDLHFVLNRVEKEEGVIGPQAAASIAAQVAAGLEHAHSLRDSTGRALGVVHRDVSPHNIFLTRSGNVRVLDFGIAKVTGLHQQTQVGALKGKVQYMSPEQARGVPLDGRSDQFALGIVLWEMVTGRRLMLREDPIQSLDALLHEPIPSPSSVSEEIPPVLERIIMRMLERDREKRFDTCAQLENELRRWMKSVDATTNDASLVANLLESVVPTTEDAGHWGLDPEEAKFVAEFGDTPLAQTRNRPISTPPQPTPETPEMPTPSRATLLWSEHPPAPSPPELDPFALDPEGETEEKTQAMPEMSLANLHDPRFSVKTASFGGVPAPSRPPPPFRPPGQRNQQLDAATAPPSTAATSPITPGRSLGAIDPWGKTEVREVDDGPSTARPPSAPPRAQPSSPPGPHRMPPPPGSTPPKARPVNAPVSSPIAVAPTQVQAAPPARPTPAHAAPPPDASAGMSARLQSAIGSMFSTETRSKMIFRIAVGLAIALISGLGTYLLLAGGSNNITLTIEPREPGLVVEVDNAPYAGSTIEVPRAEGSHRVRVIRRGQVVYDARHTFDRSYLIRLQSSAP